MQQSASNPRFQRPALAGILLLALILRLPGLSLGLPEFCNGDEEKLNERSVRMVHQWTWDPGSQNYPALMFDLAAAVDLAAVLIPQVRAVIHLESWASFRDWIARQPLPLGLTVWLGRLLSLVCGLASLWLFYYVVRLHADPGAALGATALMATAPVHQWLSDLFKTDTLLLLAVLLCLHAGYRIGQRARPRDYVLAAVGLGLALAIKFYFLAAIPILAGAFLHRLEQPGQARAGYRRLALALLAGFLLFALLSPYSLIHWRQALRWIALESASQAGAIPMLKRTTGRLWHAPGLFMLTAVYPLALGIPLYLLALLGLPDLFRLSRPAKYVWVAFAASLFVIYSLGSKLASPHIYFIHLPALCLAAGLRYKHRA